MLLPDPYDADWDTCLAAYRHGRQVALNNAYKVLQDVARLEDRVYAIEDRGGPTEAENEEITDRLRIQHILQNIERQTMLGLRFYLDLCRVVHKRADRETYEIVFHNARENGVPPWITRRVLDEQRRKDN